MAVYITAQRMATSSYGIFDTDRQHSYISRDSYLLEVYCNVCYGLLYLASFYKDHSTTLDFLESKSSNEMVTKFE